MYLELEAIILNVIFHAYGLSSLDLMFSRLSKIVVHIIASSVLQLIARLDKLDT